MTTNNKTTNDKPTTITVDIPTTLSKTCAVSGSDKHGKPLWDGASYNVHVRYAITKNMVDKILQNAVSSAIIQTQRALRDNCNARAMVELSKTGYDVPLDNAGGKPKTKTQQIDEYKIRTATLSQREKIDVMFDDGLIDETMRDALYVKHGIDVTSDENAE